MELIPIPVLSQILTSVGPIYELIQIALVCKRWKKAIEATYLNVSFQGARIWKFQASMIQPEIILSMCNSKSISFKIQSLDLRNVGLVNAFQVIEIFSQPGLLKVNLTNAIMALDMLWESILILKDRKMRDEFEFGLEELRISNNRDDPIYFDALIKIFPNLKILYAGNTRASREDFINIVKGFKKLELLDVTNCSNIGQMDENLNELKEALSGSSIRKLFITDLGPKTIKYLEKCHIEVVNKWIGTILDELNDESDLQYLENWLNLGIDVDLGKNDNFDKNNIFPYWELIRSNKSEFLITEAFKIMIRHGLDLSFYSREHDISLLNTAISAGNCSLVNLFLKHKVDIYPLHKFDLNGIPAVSYASFCGNIPIFQLFLKYNLYPKDFDNKTFCNPICAALRNSQKEMFEFLKQNNFSDFRCVKHNDYWTGMPAAIEIVIKNWDYFPFSLLHEVAKYHIRNLNRDLAFKIIDSLIKKAIAENQQETLRNLFNNHNRPIIVLAAENSYSEIVEKVVESGFDINAVDYNGWTALILASWRGNLDSVVFLLNHEAIIDIKDISGMTALHYAAENGHLEIINELIRFGANPSSTCKEGYSPLDLAEKSQKTEAYNLLKSLGAKKGKNCRLF